MFRRIVSGLKTIFHSSKIDPAVTSSDEVAEAQHEVREFFADLGQKFEVPPKNNPTQE